MPGYWVEIRPEDELFRWKMGTRHPGREPDGRLNSTFEVLQEGLADNVDKAKATAFEELLDHCRISVVLEVHGPTGISVRMPPERG